MTDTFDRLKAALAARYAIELGDRSDAGCLQLWRRISLAYKRCYSFSDFWDAYQSVFAADRHQSVGKDGSETKPYRALVQHLAAPLGSFCPQTPVVFQIGPLS